MYVCMYVCMYIYIIYIKYIKKYIYIKYKYIYIYIYNGKILFRNLVLLVRFATFF